MKTKQKKLIVIIITLLLTIMLFFFLNQTLNPKQNQIEKTERQKILEQWRVF